MGKSIKFQVLLVLLVQFAALLAVVLSTMYLVKLRQHDYLILNLTGQLRVITQNLVTQSRHYVDQAPRDYTSYNRDLGLFNKDLQTQVKAFDEIIQSLKARSLKADLFSSRILDPKLDGKSKVPRLTDAQPIICKWNAQARSQMDHTAVIWNKFHKGLQAALGNNPKEPRLEAAAEYILLNEETLSTSTAELADNFRSMMEDKLSQIQLLNQVGLGILISISLVIIIILYRRIFKPIDSTVAGFHRAANGDFSHQVPVYAHNEIGEMTESFNYLTRRLATLLRLTDEINQASTLDETLQLVFDRFPVFLPIEWTGILRSIRNNTRYHLDNRYGSVPYDISENEQFESAGSLFLQTAESGKPFCSCVELLPDDDWEQDAFIQRMQQIHLRSFFYLPLISNPLENAVLVLATTAEDAYDASHLEFLTNIAGQVGHSFNKTIGMESLVISTVKGLAKLAESRDPETGDHLFRMSHYSALIADELSKTDQYRDYIDTGYIRDILTFAPMHDIGKVGINDSILLKNGKLDEAEYREMQRHPTIGGAVLRQCEKQMNAVGRSIFQLGIEIAEGHHEKFDGSGYPSQVKGKDIPLSARIVAAADVFDALTSKRPYKEAWPIDKAMEYIESQAGKHFDPDIIAAMKKAMPTILSLYEKHKHV